MRQVLDTKTFGLPLQTVLSLGKDIASGLQYLITQGIKYPILTSNNIIIQDQDAFGNPVPLSAVLSDLGDHHAQWKEPERKGLPQPGPVFTAAGVTNGRPGGLPRVDSRTLSLMPSTGMDVPTLVYNFSIILWEIFTCLKPKSYLPATHDTSVKDVNNVPGNDDYYLPEKIPDDCPRELANLFYVCWSKKPYLRLTFGNILEVLNLMEQKFVGNSAQLLISERINKTKGSFLNRIDHILLYIDQVSSLTINVTDLVGALEDLADAIEHGRNLELSPDFTSADMVIEVLESVFPSKIVDKTSKKLDKYWVEYSRSKRAKAKLERAVGQIVRLSAELRAKSMPVVAPQVSALQSTRNRKRASGISPNIGSNKLIHQIMVENLSPGNASRVLTAQEKALVDEEEEEKSLAAFIVVGTPNKAVSPAPPPDRSISPNPPPASSASSLLDSLGISGGLGALSGGLGGAIGTGDPKNASAGRPTSGERRPLSTGPRASGEFDPNAPIDVLAMANASSSSISSSVAASQAAPQPTSPRDVRPVGIDFATLSTDDYLSALATGGHIGKSLADNVDTKGTSSNVSRVRPEGGVMEVSHIEGKQYYGEEIGYGPIRKQVPGSTPKTVKTTAAAAPIARSASGADSSKWSKATIPKRPEDTTTVAAEPPKLKKTTKSSLFRAFFHWKIDDDSESERNDPSRQTVLPDSMPPELHPQRETWLTDNFQGGQMIDSAPGSANSDYGGLMPASAPSPPGSDHSDEGGRMPVTKGHEVIVQPTLQAAQVIDIFDSPFDHVGADPKADTSAYHSLDETNPSLANTSSENTPTKPAEATATQTQTSPQKPPISTLSSTDSLANSAEFYVNNQATPEPVPVETFPTQHGPPATNPLAASHRRPSTPETPATAPASAPAHTSTDPPPLASRARITSTRRISLVERLNWDPSAKEFWRTSFGLGVNTVPWSRFISSLTEYMVVLPEDVTRLQLILDNNGAGYVSAATFEAFLNSHGPLHNALRRTYTYMSQPWFMWYLSHEDCITMLKHTAPGTFVLRFSQSTPGQFALTVKQSAGAFMKCMIYSHRGKYLARPDDTVEFQDLLSLVRSTSATLTAFSEDWHHNAWFKGVLSAESSAEMLDKLPVGEFLLRLSPRGPHYILALVTAPGKIVQEVFAREDATQFVVFTTQGENRITCDSMVAFVKLRVAALLHER